jgi:hypothetical protein
MVLTREDQYLWWQALALLALVEVWRFQLVEVPLAVVISSSNLERAL